MAYTHVVAVDPTTGACGLGTLPPAATPAGTNVSAAINCATGVVTVGSSTGTGATFNPLSEFCLPAAWARVGTTNNQGTSGLKPPNVSISTGKSELTGGFTYNAAGAMVVPKTGYYWVQYRSAAIATQQILYVSPSRLLVKLMINGVQFSQLIMDDHVGIHVGEELNDYRRHLIALNAGDTLTIETTEETAGHYLDAYDLSVEFQSNVG